MSKGGRKGLKLKNDWNCRIGKVRFKSGGAVLSILESFRKPNDIQNMFIETLSQMDTADRLNGQVVLGMRAILWDNGSLDIRYSARDNENCDDEETKRFRYRDLANMFEDVSRELRNFTIMDLRPPYLDDGD